MKKSSVSQGHHKDSGRWKPGKIVDRITRKDGTVRGCKARTGNGYITERPIQLVADLEIRKTTAKDAAKLNPDAQTFEPRQRNERSTKSNANNRIYGIVMNELDEH